MPTSSTLSSTSSPPITRLEHSHSWTDDLVVCPFSGFGSAVNQLYRHDGHKQEQHEFEDRSFHFKQDDAESYLYGVFDGHGGVAAAEFARQKLPAEILLGSLRPNMRDDEVTDLLDRALFDLEKDFFNSIGDPLAEKATLLMQLPEHLTVDEAKRQHPNLADRLARFDRQTSGGTSVVICLVYNQKIYVANVGNCRALLVTRDDQGVLHVLQLSNDHTVNNPLERQRVQQLGVDLAAAEDADGRLCGRRYTRCIGDYQVKERFEEIAVLSNLTVSPFIAKPTVQSGIPITRHCLFMLLMSDGLYESLSAGAAGGSPVNSEIASLVYQEFAFQRNMHAVAQNVVNKVVQFHNDKFTEGLTQCEFRDDISLLVRNFSMDLWQPITPHNTSAQHRLPPHNPLYAWPPSPSQYTGTAAEGVFTAGTNTLRYQYTGGVGSQPFTNGYRTGTGMSTASDSDTDSMPMMQGPTVEKYDLDADKRIASYIGFDDFRSVTDGMSEEQRSAFREKLSFAPQSFEPIAEEADEGGSRSAEPSLVANEITTEIISAQDSGDSNNSDSNNETVV